MVVRVAFLHLAILIQSSSCLGHGLPCVCKRNTLASFRDSVFFWYNEQSDHSIIIKIRIINIGLYTIKTIWSFGKAKRLAHF